MGGETASPNQSRRCGRRQGGFLLIEALLAVFFLAVGITTVLRSYGSSISALRISGEYTRALMHLEESLWKFEAAGSIAPGSYTGQFPGSDERFHWRVDAVELTDLGLCETRATVSWEKKGKNREVSVITYLKLKQ